MPLSQAGWEKPGRVCLDVWLLDAVTVHLSLASAAERRGTLLRASGCQAVVLCLDVLVGDCREPLAHGRP